MSMNTDNLINSLASDLQEVKPACHPFKKALPWFSFGLLYVCFAVAVLGIRPDFVERISNDVYLLELMIVFLMSLSAAFCSLWLGVPDMRGQRWMLAVPFSMLSLLVFWLLAKTILYLEAIPAMYWSGCIGEALIFGVIPAVTLVFLASRGKTTKPQLMSVVNTIAVGGLGYLGLRITCPVEEIGHLMFHHFLPYVFIGGVIFVAGIKIYRW